MRYTVAVVAEKTMELMGVEPLYVHYGEDRDINGFSTYTRERRRQDILWLNDNSGGLHPYGSCTAKHCVYIASRGEEAGGLPVCDPWRSLIVLPHTVKLRRLVTAMEQCFAFFNAWSDGLLELVGRDVDWDELLDAGHRLMNNPMIIYNRSMRVLAYTKHDGTRDAVWSDTVREGTAPVDTPRQSADLMRFLSEVESHDAPFRHISDGMSDHFWCAPVQMDGRRLGMVNVIEFHCTLSQGRQDLLRIYSTYMAIRMRRTGYGIPTPDAAPQQLMADLMGSAIASRERLNTRLIAVDWRVSKHFRFFSLRAELPFLSEEQWRSILDRLDGLGLNGLKGLIGEKEAHIGLLLTAETPARFDRAIEVVGQFCAMNRLRAGISDPYLDLLETPRYSRQAEVALELEKGLICHYAKARYARMVRYLQGHPYGEDLLHPALTRLAALDRDEGSEYIPTLTALVWHTFNQLETAESLGIHRTTLAYRLRRIQELTDLNLSDPDQIFHVAVSLKLMEKKQSSEE